MHGSIYEYMQNRDLNALDQQQRIAGDTSQPRYDYNRLGATIGGRIVKNKLFYFGLFEYDPLGRASNPAGTVEAPTSAGISLLNGMSGLSKTNLGIFEQYVPVASGAAIDSTVVNGVSIPLGALTFASANYSNTYNAVIAVDYNLSDKDQLHGRYFYNNYQGLDSVANLPVFYEPQPNLNKSGTFSEFHNFSPTLQNEFRISYSRNNANVTAGYENNPKANAEAPAPVAEPEAKAPEVTPEVIITVEATPEIRVVAAAPEGKVAEAGPARKAGEPAVAILDAVPVAVASSMTGALRNATESVPISEPAPEAPIVQSREPASPQVTVASAANATQEYGAVTAPEGESSGQTSGEELPPARPIAGPSGRRKTKRRK